MRNYFIEALVFVVLISIFLFCLGFVAPVQFLFLMMAGWGMFLRRVVPQIEFDLGALVIGGGAIVLFAIGLHLLLRWFVAAVPKNPEVQPAEWKWRWTFAATVLTLLMFVAGISFVGITHQVAWLATSDEPLMASSFMAAYRVGSQGKLRQFSVSLQSYEIFAKSLPPGATADADGRVLHSWMSLLLPFCEQRPVYDAIHFDRPWDDPVQGDVFKRPLKMYESSYPQLKRTDKQGRALTHFAANVHVIGGTGTLTRGSITNGDGTTNTLMLGEAAGDFKAWGQPGNWRNPALGINQTSAGFGSPNPAGATFAFADGSVRFMSTTVSPEVLRALATPNGGEPPPKDYEY